MGELLLSSIYIEAPYDDIDASLYKSSKSLKLRRHGDLGGLRQGIKWFIIT